MPSTIAFIGAGNMARALIGGLLDRGHDPSALVASDPDPDTRRELAQRHGLRTTDDNGAAARDAGVVVLAVKPQVIDDVLASIAGAIGADDLVVSVAAGVPVERIERGLGERRAVVRAMPNTPALLGMGATGLFASPACSAGQLDAATALFETVGLVEVIGDESLMDAVTAVSGSGPAYFFALAEALADAGRAAGLDAGTATRLACRTAAGAGAMLADGEADAAELRRRVTSPGGTTAAALESFADSGLADIVRRAVDAAILRGRELGDG
ncbi:MAG: pyrroline-5-carboxylate reductase [Wenzhouxiangellaceae bacterium]|nr:pyrroline-5-carboxylate reductase [Wenzhouxiangellaceae bacterium]